MDRSLKLLILCSNIVLIGIIASGVGWFINLLSPILTPFLVGAFLAYLGDPLADKLEQRKCSRSLAVILVFSGIIACLFLALLLIIPSVQSQIIGIGAKVPEYKAQVINIWLPWLSKTFGIAPDSINSDAIKKLFSLKSSVFTDLLSSIAGSSMAIISWIGNVVLIPVVTFYLLRDWDVIVAMVRKTLPRNIEPTVVKLATESNQVLGSFIRGQFMVMIALSIIYFTGLTIIGLDLALLIGLTAGLISFVPYLGCIVGIILAVTATLLQPGSDIYTVIYVLIVFGIGQTLEGTVLTPKLVGDKIGLHAVAVIFAVLAGGQLFGFFGILIALPTAAVIMVLLRNLYNAYINSSVYATNENADNNDVTEALKNEK